MEQGERKGTAQQATVMFARVALREIPLGAIRAFVSSIGKAGPRALGDACGNGCGNACGNGCIDGLGLTLDRYGHAGLNERQLEEVRGNIPSLQAALREEAAAMLR